MNREEAKELLPIIQAFAEGKTIETYLEYDNEWKGCSNPAFNPENKYRIKPESKYRPFKDAEECWNEMLKHQSFGWVKTTDDDKPWYENITTVMSATVWFNMDDDTGMLYEKAMKVYTFADGTPFGIKEGGEE